MTDKERFDELVQILRSGTPEEKLASAMRAVQQSGSWSHWFCTSGCLEDNDAAK